jgi:1-acyl-sn-glycerol-3-phosphate acyltransferase
MNRWIDEHVRQLVRAGGFLAATSAMLPIFAAHTHRAPEDQKGLIRDLWVRRWAKALLDLFDIELIVRGSVPPPTRAGSRGRLIVANHRSAIDIGVLLATFGGTLVSRADLATWPILGRAARSVGTVFVDRSSIQSGALVVRDIQRRLEEGDTIGIFPEGTTFGDDEVRPFHRGAFIAALNAKAEVLPVGLAYPAGSRAAFIEESFLAHVGRVAKTKAVRVGVAVGKPLDTSQMNGKRLTEAAQRAVGELVAEARQLVGP